MNTTDTTIDNSGSFPVATSSEVVNTTTIPASTSGGDVESIMRKMAEQQSQIENLNKQLETKSNDVEKLSQKQRDEMMHVYQTVIKGWVESQDAVDPKTREEFNNGISNLAKNADDNGIW
jgi:predicted  nucleic acid-binding Zn-ribbon protein